MKLEARLARKTAGPAISSGAAMRPKGVSRSNTLTWSATSGRRFIGDVRFMRDCLAAGALDAAHNVVGCICFVEISVGGAVVVDDDAGAVPGECLAGGTTDAA